MKLLIVGETGCQNSIDECIHYLPRKCPKRKYEKIVMHAKFLSKYQWKVPLSELKVCLLVGASVNIWFAVTSCHVDNKNKMCLSSSVIILNVSAIISLWV